MMLDVFLIIWLIYIMELPNGEKGSLARLGLSLRTTAVLTRWRKRVKESRTRYFCLCELVSTEADYNRDLLLILEKMQIPLRNCGAISEEEEKELFPNIQGMIDLSSQLLTDVTNLKDKWSSHSTLIGKTMIRYSKFLQIYSQFFRSYRRTLAHLQGLLQQEQVRVIQSQLAPKSFEDLWSKPFQRPLNSYFKELSKCHPDHADVARAIQCYEQVSQRNNKALQNKQKSETLVALQARFAGIIDGDSKYYIDQIDATFMDTRVKCHILSNMLLIATADQPIENQIMRIYFDQYSFVVPLKNLLYFKHRLYICGRRRSIHLTFADKETRNQCEREVRGIINQLYKSEYTRKELSSIGRRTTYLRDSLEQARRSYTQLSQILPKPPRLLVLGQVRRRYACPKSYKIYFIIRFMLPFGEDNCQYLYVDLEQLLSLQGTMRTLYPQELKEMPYIEQPSKGMNAPQMRINSVRSLEYKSIYATILLNYLFRHPQIVKRTDIIAHCLHVGEPMWIYCRYAMMGCVCFYCNQGKVLANVQCYETELNARRINKQQINTFFCPFRTIHAQNMLAQADLSLIPTAIDRLLFLRCERGRLDYRIADSTPGSPLRKKISIQVERLDGNRLLQILIDPQQRVGQILQACGRYHRMRMEDYELFLCVNKSTYLLGRDEILWQVLQNQTAAGDNFFSFFKNAFGEKEDFSFRVYLRKLWVLEAAYEKANYQREEQVGFLIEQFMLRLRRQEIKLTIEDTSTLYACYFAYQRLGKEGAITIAEEELKALIAPKRWKAMETQQRAEMMSIVRMKVDHLRGKLTNTQILRNIWNYTVRMGENCPGWSAYYFSAAVLAHPQYEQGFEVKIGADLNKLYVMQAEKMTTVLQFNLHQVYPLLTFSSWQLHIGTASFEYIFTGDALFHLQDAINTYLLYRELQE